MHIFTEQQARKLAATDKGYAARKVSGNWVVWCNDSDHVVEFDSETVERLAPVDRFANLTAACGGSLSIENLQRFQIAMREYEIFMAGMRDMFRPIGEED